MDVLEIAKNLIKVKSISPNDNGCFHIIQSELSKMGFDINFDNYKNVENLIATFGEKGPIFCFLGHTDVVPEGPIDEWKHHPYDAVVENDILFGRGAADMKSSIAAFISATSKFLDKVKNPNFQIWILLTSNEEGEIDDGKIDKIISRLMNEEKFIDYCLVGEASSSEVVGDVIRRGRRGSLTGYLTVIGKQGHVAYPNKAINPIHHSGEIIEKLSNIVWDKGNKFFEPTTFQVSNINSGTGATNVVPKDLNMIFNLRFSPESNAAELKNRIEKILNDGEFKYEIEWVQNAEPYFTEKDQFINLIQSVLEKVNGKKAIINNGGGTSDGRWIAPMGTQVIELGPLNKTIHQIDEQIPISDLEKTEKIYLGILEEINSN